MPLIIAQGANESRVKQAEADQMVKALKEKDIPVAYTPMKAMVCAA